ncbi:MAG: hypothetical protein GY924_13190 [Planctomycetaceae bacterium]|nr:hypothetical protein [Planctomycetaceae bacterium]
MIPGLVVYECDQLMAAAHQNLESLVLPMRIKSVARPAVIRGFSGIKYQIMMKPDAS